MWYVGSACAPRTLKTRLHGQVGALLATRRAAGAWTLTGTKSICHKKTVQRARFWSQCLATSPVPSIPPRSGKPLRTGTPGRQKYMYGWSPCAHPYKLWAFSYLTIYHSAVPYISVHTSTPPKPEEFPGVRTKLRPIQNARLVGGSQPSALPNAAAALFAIFLSHAGFFTPSQLRVGFHQKYVFWRSLSWWRNLLNLVSSF